MGASIEQLDNKEGHDRLIGGNKKYYAARAWQGYLNSNNERGAIIVKMSEVEEVRRSPGFYKVPIQYAPAGGDQLAKLGLWPDERMAKALQDYKPEEEVVFVFVHLNGVTSTCYTWKTPTDLTPPKAYEQYRGENPYGVRLDPNRTHLEILKLLVNHEFELKKQQKGLERKILSDSSQQAGFIKSLVDGQQELKMELEASGIGIDKNGEAYILEQDNKKPGTEFERFQDQARIIDYLTVTTAVNRMAQVYEQRKASSEDWLREVAQAGLETLDDKRTVIMAACMAQDWGPEPDIQELFLLQIVARIRTRLKKFPRIEGILKAEGGNPEDVFLEKLLCAVPLAWSRYEHEPHSPSKNDSLKF